MSTGRIVASPEAMRVRMEIALRERVMPEWADIQRLLAAASKLDGALGAEAKRILAKLDLDNLKAV